jgi:hypothetical protein
MKTNDFKPFDGVADSMGQAAALLGVPLEAIKAAKRSGSTAFRGSRVNVTQLRQEIGSAEKGPTTADVLLIIAHDVAQCVSYALARYPGKRFRAESDKLCHAIQLGLGAAVCIVEPDSADEFLAESAALFESIFEKPARKKLPRVINQHNENARVRRASSCPSMDCYLLVITIKDENRHMFILNQARISRPVSEIAPEFSAPRLQPRSGPHADNHPTRARMGAVLRVRDRAADRIGPCIPDCAASQPIAD